MLYREYVSLVFLNSEQKLFIGISEETCIVGIDFTNIISLTRQKLLLINYAYSYFYVKLFFSKISEWLAKDQANKNMVYKLCGINNERARIVCE